MTMSSIDAAISCAPSNLPSLRPVARASQPLGRRTAFGWMAAGIVAIMLQATGVFAQGPDPAAYPKLARDGHALSRGDAEGLESLLNNSPDDIAARIKVLGFYFRGAAMTFLGHDATVEARRRHILWLIEHHPESEATDLSEATIDPAGHSLADPIGYEQASALWIEEARRHQESAAVLSHAAKFFQLSNKERAISLLRQAQHAAPTDRELSARIGYVYALAILGVDMINQNGLPMSHNAAEARGGFATRAVSELKNSSDVIVVGVAGAIVGQYGVMLAAIQPGKFTVDYFPLAEDLLNKARELEPANPAWPTGLEEIRKLQEMARQRN